VVVVYAASRVAGLGREIGVASLFGTSTTADRLATAFVVASVTSTVAGEFAFAGAVRWLSTGDPVDARYGELLAAGRRVAWVVAAGFAIVAPFGALLITGDPDDGARETAVLVLLLVPTVALAVMSACAGARLTLEGRLARVNIAQALPTVGALAGVVTAALSADEPELIVAGWSVGAGGGYAVARSGLPRAPARSLRRPSVRTILGVGAPVAVASALTALQALTDRTIAGRLGDGSIAALSYADRLFLLPTGFVLGVVAPAALGVLAGQARESVERAGRTSLAQLHGVAAVSMPVAMVAVGLSPWLVDLVFRYGAFGSDSAAATTEAFDGFAVGIVAVSLSLTLTRTAQALLDLRMLVPIAVVAVLVNAGISLGLSGPLDLFGITLGTSVTALLTGIYLSVPLGRRLGPDWTRLVRVRLLAPAGAALVAGAVIAASAQEGHLSDLGRLGLATVVVVPLALALRRPPGVAR